MVFWSRWSLWAGLSLCSPWVFAAECSDIVSLESTTPMVHQSVNAGKNEAAKQPKVQRTAHKLGSKSTKKKTTRSASTRISGPQVLSFYGEVAIDSDQGRVPLVGELTPQTATLRNGDVVTTGEQSFVTIYAGDNSKITIPSHSQVRLVRINRAPIQLDLVYGRVDNKVTPQKTVALKTGGSSATKQPFKYVITTPALNLGVRGTEFGVEHENQVSFVSVKEGLVATQAKDRCEAPQFLAKNEGIKISAVASEPLSLLPAPDLQNRAAIIYGRVANLQLSSVAGAQRYHVQVAHDPDFVYLMEEQFSESPKLSLKNLNSGYYFLRITAVDAKGVEGEVHTSKILFQLLPLSEYEVLQLDS